MNAIGHHIGFRGKVRIAYDEGVVARQQGGGLFAKFERFPYGQKIISNGLAFVRLRVLALLTHDASNPLPDPAPKKSQDEMQPRFSWEWTELASFHSGHNE